MGKKLERTLRVGRRFPDFSERGGEPRGESEPEGNRRSVAGLRVVGEEGKRDGKVVRERAVSRRGRTEVGVVVENGDRRREDGTERERRGKEKAIETRRPRERTGSVACEVEVGVFVVWGVHDVEMRLEGPEEREEGSRRERRRGAGGIGMGLDEVEVTTKKGGDRGRNGEKVVDELGLESDLVLTRFEVDVEKLKGMVERIFWGVTTQLGVAITSGGERDVMRRVETEDRGSVNDESTGLFHGAVVAGNQAAGEGREGLLFKVGKVGFLEADDVVARREIG